MNSIRTAFLAGAVIMSAFTANYALAQSEIVQGQITKVDSGAGKITIKHGPIKKFDMDDGMTMVFRAGDPAMLSAVKPGDKVNFEADKVNGQFTVTRIEKAK